MQFSEFQERRMAIYLGGIARAPYEVDCTTTELAGVLALSAIESRKHLIKRLRAVLTRGVTKRYDIYYRQAQLLFSEVAPRSCFRLVAEDNRIRFDVPVILKSRMIADRDSKGVLLPLNWYRHWALLADLAGNDCPFDDKDDKLVWRGTTTGPFCRRSPADAYGSRYHLAHLSDLAPDIDVKFTKIVQQAKCGDDFPIAAVQAHMGPTLSLREQLSSKYLLCLEGNDVASGLKWMMASNSTVIMPEPTCETWFCEGELIAWEHYVPVKHDLSNINEIYAWCLANPLKCKDIARNGRAFVAQFLDYATERAIINEVIRTYLDHSTTDVVYSWPERLLQFWSQQKLRSEKHRFKKQFEKVAQGFGSKPEAP